MKLALALGVAFAAMTMAAQAQSDRVIVRHHGGFEIDANDDGWVSRAEASAGADRMFAELDSNDDNRLTEADHARFEHEFHVSLPHPGGLPDDVDEGDCERTETGSGDNRRVTIVCEGGPHVAGERHVRREVHVERRVRDVANVPPVPPIPPVPPVPPMGMMIFASHEEADRNGDDALSQEEFRTMHMRFFDAGDANGDGRIRAVPPPEPPVPPVPPTPPSPPRY